MTSRELDLRPLVGSWALSLKAERKSPQTIKSYAEGITQFLRWCETAGEPAKLDRQRVNGFIAQLLDDGISPATARARQLAVRRFSAWLLDEGEITSDALVGLKAPKLDQKVIEPLTDEQLKAMIAACAGPDLRDRRDEAIVRLMLESGARAGEVAVMLLADADLQAGAVIIRKGKGGKGRSVPFGPQTIKALDRYLRLRSRHPLAAQSPDLWLGERGKQFGYDALHKSLGMRAERAGITGFHPHLLRHTAAHRWLAAGGSEGGLMAVAGWTRPDMLIRYTKAQASNRAAAEARTLNLGDI